MYVFRDLRVNMPFYQLLENAYGFSKNTLKLLLNFISSHWKRIEIDLSFSLWKKFLQVLLLGSVHGPVLFDVFISVFLPVYIVIFVFCLMILNVAFVIKA